MSTGDGSGMAAKAGWLCGGQCTDPEGIGGFTDLLHGCREPVSVVEREGV